MPKRRPEHELLAAALASAHDCPSLEDLELLLEEGAPARLKRHVDACPHCQTELHMLRSFTSNEVAVYEKAAVDSIAARLRTRSPAVAANDDHSSWKRILALHWLTPAAAGLAVALAVAGVTIELRRARQPSLETATGSAEVFRSSAIAVLRPTGDLHEKPSEIRWEAAPNAARYRVRIMEVDHTQLWSTETAAPQIALSASVEKLIVPAKTLLIQVTAFDAAGSKIAESETVRFRLLQNAYAQ